MSVRTTLLVALAICLASGPARAQPYDWIYNPATGNHYAKTEMGITWPDAQAEARALGAYMVSIESDAENIWVWNAFKAHGHFWIGFSDQDLDGTWQWDSGETVTYTYWFDGAPDNDGGDQYWAVMDFRSARWDDEGASRWENRFAVFELEGLSEQPDPDLSSVTGGVGTVFACPAGDGQALDSVGASIQVVALNILGNPLEGIPAADIWLESVVPGDLVLCSGGIAADAPTDAQGMTTIRGTPAAGGCVQGGLYAVVQGVPLTSSPLSLQMNSVDSTGDLTVGLEDVGQFAAALLGSYSFCADYFADGQVSLVDVGVLAAHLGHGCP